MFKYFTNAAAAIIILGIILFVSSFFVSVSFWYGVELVKGGVFIFVIGMFMSLMNRDCNKEKIPQ